MGALASKNVSKAASVGARRYPTTTNIPESLTNKPSSRLPSNSTHGPQVHPNTTYSDSRDHSVNSDTSDPDLPSMSHSQFSTRLRQLGPVQPSPTLSHSAYPPTSSQLTNSMFPCGSETMSPENIKLNPTLLVLQSRKRISEEAGQEFENAARGGDKVLRRFLDVGMLRTVVGLMEEGRAAEDIEKRMGLEKGVVGGLGKGVFAASQAPAEDAGKIGSMYNS